MVMANIKYKLRLPLLLAFVLILSACAREESVNVNQDSIFVEYRLVYDGNQDKTFARATFRFGGATGTLLELSDPATITFDGEVLTWNPLLAYYEKEYAGVVNGGLFS